MEQIIVYGLIWIFGMLAPLGLYVWATREDRKGNGQAEVLGDASLLEHPDLPSPRSKREPREAEPMGA